MKKLSLKEQAYQQIKQLIIDGNFKPGESLTERELTESLSMSRTPIRSALEKLEADGFIQNFPNKGPVVSNISFHKLVNIYDLRIAIESHSAKQYSHFVLTEEMKMSFIENLAAQKNAMDEQDSIKFSYFDREFHYLILKFYGNEEIIKVFDQIQNQLLLLALEVFKSKQGNLELFFNEHQIIYNLILEGNGEEAANIITKHLEYGKQTLL
ncbi:GntR family transcriptional regulator [Psychrobacillus sp. INOP01]|uniref:GntR family transcriptional regulator n=1 Tax=Psychrobacillus sp. INOP01 TaxID=2829187 RepID=UPI001BADEF6F|nr:GntR family transcriptional regulator [Psychrobacillus sp. INOP01]QUG42590.1 GntR family transcriptional regulator [Psychrobacillus sp. INOP01]